MTTINLHGILAHEFGQVFSMNIRKPKEAIAAININKPNFISKIIELSKEGIHYAIIIDGKDIKESLELEITKSPKVIDIVPMICGSGVVVAALGAIAMFASTTGAVAALGAGYVAAFSMVGALMLSIGVQMMMAPNPEKAGKAPRIEVGGVKESFLFGSKANLVEQGSPVPVGYGRLRVGSNVILTTIHSHPIKNTAEAKLRGSSSGLDISEENVSQDKTPIKGNSKKSKKSTAKVVKKTKTGRGNS